MNFNPTYKTKDNLFEIEINMEELSYEPQYRWYGSSKKDMTINSIQVYNTETFSYSSKHLYISKKGLYFNSNRGRYYIKDLEAIS